MEVRRLSQCLAGDCVCQRRPCPVSWRLTIGGRMEAGHGFILLITHVCTYVTVRRLVLGNVTVQEGGTVAKGAAHRRWQERKATLIAAVTVLAFYIVQDRARHVYSSEARCCKEFERVISLWESGEEQRAIERIRNLAHSTRPWEPGDLDDRE